VLSRAAAAAFPDVTMEAEPKSFSIREVIRKIIPETRRGRFLRPETS